jgi:hypothetical protein
VLPPVVEVPVVEVPVVEVPVVEVPVVEVAVALVEEPAPGGEAIWAFEAPVETTPPAAVSLAAPLAPAVETEPVEELYAPTQPQGQSVEDTFLAGVVEVEMQIPEPAVVPEPAAAPEKKRLPRPQAHSVPKMVALPAEMLEAELARAPVAVPNTEDTFQFLPEPEPEPEPEPVPEPVVTTPRAIELRYLPAPVEVLPVDEPPVEEAPSEPTRVPKRLDDEAIAALKATGQFAYRGQSGPATPPSTATPPRHRHRYPHPPPPRYVPPPDPSKGSGHRRCSKGQSPAGQDQEIVATRAQYLLGGGVRLYAPVFGDDRGRFAHSSGPQFFRRVDHRTPGQDCR